MPVSITNAFLGEDRKLRHIWRAALFLALAVYVVQPLADELFALTGAALHLSGALTAGAIAFNEFENFVIALLCTLPFAVYERRRVDSYGLSVERAFRLPLFEGVLAGVLMAGAVALGMLALGGMQVHGLALTGTALAWSALGWLGANILVGVAEEFWFRAYFLQSLWRSIGFWPASLVIAGLFAADHYFYKAGENAWDVVTLVSLSLLMCYTVLKTGTLWFAIGFHIAFDYMQLFVIGTPNGDKIPAGRLLDVTFAGPAWLTGGVLGTEASWLMYPAIALLWLYIWRRFRPAAASLAEPPPV
jgi:membrane protease YdiL (CAAX protease family)